MKLEGYESTNYRVQCDSGAFVLKRYPDTPDTLALLEAENQILNRLDKLSGWEFPITIPNSKGLHLTREDGSIYRLLSFLEGNFLGDVGHTPALLRSLGRFLGQTDKSLLNSTEPAISAKESQWDLKNFRLNYKYLEFIPDPKDRSLVDYFFLQFDENVYPIGDQLRKSIIHNDANDWNVLTKKGLVSGIIDFGDMCHSWLINELAVALTYIMMDKKQPLEVARTVIGAYHEVVPLKVQELDVLYYLIAARLCTSVCNSAYTKTIKPESAYITMSEKPAWSLLRRLVGLSPVRVSDEFRSAAGFHESKKPKPAEQLKRRGQNLSSTLSLSYDRPIQMSRSAFQYMYDAEGNTFLDAYNNIMLAGHCHPSVVRAGQRTMAKLNTNTRYLYDELLSYSEKLLAKFPPQLNKVFLVNSGSAASDLAIRLATAFTGKNKVMALEHGYHGNTREGIAISHYKYSHKNGVGQHPLTLAAPMPKAFGSGFRDDGTAGDHFAEGSLTILAEHKNTIAAFVAEPVMGCGGQVPLAKGYLAKVYPEVRAQGGVCISDEVQVGFGRLGDHFWGYEMHDIVPDMVLLGKPMGNGHPIGAVVTTSEIAKKFEKGPEFFSSFGGNPVSCAIGEAVLNVIEAEKLQEHARVVGNHLKALLANLQGAFPEIADIRGSGLFLGVELSDTNGHPNTKLAAHIKNNLRQKFILVGTDGPHDNVLKIKPPLCFTKDDAAILTNAINAILKDP